MDIEHKLDLIQQIHREQEENERYVYDNLRRRNYNKKAYDADTYIFDYNRMDSCRQETQIFWLASFRFRLLVAVLLFLCFFVMDKKKITYKEIGSNKIVQYISENMDIKDLQYLLIKNNL